MRIIYVLVLSLILVGCGSSTDNNNVEITDLSQMEGIWKSEDGKFVYFNEDTSKGENVFVEYKLDHIENKFDIDECFFVNKNNNRVYEFYRDTESGIEFISDAPDGSVLVPPYSVRVKIYLDDGILTVNHFDINDTNYDKVKKVERKGKTYADSLDEVKCDFTQRANAVTSLDDMAGLWKLPSNNNLTSDPELNNAEFLYISNKGIGHQELPLFVNYNKTKGCYEGIDDPSIYKPTSYEILESGIFEAYFPYRNGYGYVSLMYVLSKENGQLVFSNLESYTDTYVTTVNENEINVCSH